MAKLTIFFGLVLAAIGLGGKHLYGSELHPLWSGLLLILCGVLANTENPKQRMLWMHIAVTVGLVSMFVPGIMSLVSLHKLNTTGAAPLALDRIHEQMLVALVSLVYVALCVRSFIAARRARLA